MLDMRNAVESLRATVDATVNKRGKAQPFREWEEYPGYTSEKEKQVSKKFDSLVQMSTTTTSF